MNEQLHVCIDKIKNADIYEKRSGSPAPIAVDTRFMWPETGKTLKVKFLEGDPSLIKKVKEKFNLWLPYATRIKFDYVTDGYAEVRIRFDHEDGSSWSGIGQEILDIEQFPRDQHTMNFGWLDTNTDDAEIERVAVHEMGHTLGFIHEQSQPLANIDWDEEAVYAYFAKPENGGWDKRTTYSNVLERYKRQITQFTQYDPTSIMHYWFPAKLLKSRREIPGGNKLSELDKKFAKDLYGRA